MLLFDQNISYKVAKKIQHVFQGSKHLSDLRLEGLRDIDIWNFAKNNNYCIVTFDFDFIDISTLKGSPPKVIWLKMGNSTTETIVERLLSESAVILDFIDDQNIAFLEIK